MKKVWDTPGGMANSYWLEQLEEPSIVYIGKQSEYRDSYLESIIYSALFKSPFEVQFVFLNPGRGAMLRFNHLPHVLNYCDKDNIDNVLRAVFNRIERREEEKAKHNSHENIKPRIYLIMDDLYFMNFDEDIFHRIMLHSRVANVFIIAFASETCDAASWFARTTYLGDVDFPKFITDEEIESRNEFWKNQVTFFDRFRLDKLYPIAETGISKQKISKDMTGLEYEEYCAKRLPKFGYKHLKVTRGSGDFGADIIGTDSHGNRVCFQCKKYNGSVGVSAVQEVIASMKYYNCSKAVVITTATFTKAAKELAEKADVKLFEKFS